MHLLIRHDYSCPGSVLDSMSRLTPLSGNAPDRATAEASPKTHTQKEKRQGQRTHRHRQKPVEPYICSLPTLALWKRNTFAVWTYVRLSACYITFRNDKKQAKLRAGFRARGLVNTYCTHQSCGACARLLGAFFAPPATSSATQLNNPPAT